MSGKLILDDINRKIYFNEELHRYTDHLNNTYLSMTTLLHKYEHEFDEKAMIQRVIKSPDSRYYRWDARKVALEWKTLRDNACAKGNNKHNFLESAIKNSTGYCKLKERFTNGRLYTVFDVINDPTIGRINIDEFIKSGVADRFPTIFELIRNLHNLGFKFYAEIGVFDWDNLISGMIDLLAIRNNEFIIIDWKTNKFKDLRYESGYYKKDRSGNITDEFIFDNKFFKSPINHISQGTKSKYTLQLTGYGCLCEKIGSLYNGLECKGLILCHIKDQLTIDGLEEVDILPIHFWKDDFNKIINNYGDSLSKNNQTSLWD